MVSSSSLAVRAVLAVVLMVGFYALALAIAAGLVYLPVAEVLYTERLHIKLAMLCVVAAGIVLWSIVPRIDRFEDPGPVLAEGDHPDLFREIRAVSEATGQAMPVEVFLVPQINAWVSQRGGVMGFGSRRVMGLGLPLLQVLTVPQLRAVLAHEFGHFYGGDTRLGPWIYKTRGAIERTVQSLAATRSGFMALVTLPFDLYSRLFLRITLAISRAQEYSADALSARTQGARPLAEGLRRIHAAALAFETYWRDEVSPSLARGFRPPIAHGFGRFVANERIAQVLDTAVEEELKSDQASHLDTHPPLRARLAALDGLPPGDDAADDTPAIALLGDVDAAEKALLEAVLVDRDAATRLVPVAWETLGSQVYLPIWEERVGGHREALEGVVFADAPTDADGLAGLARRALGDRAAGAPEQAIVAYGAGLVASALAACLVHAGFTPEAEPGEPIRCRRGEQVVAPFELLEQLSGGEAPPDTWRATLEAVGLADTPLVGPAPDA